MGDLFAADDSPAEPRAEVVLLAVADADSSGVGESDDALRESVEADVALAVWPMVTVRPVVPFLDTFGALKL